MQAERKTNKLTSIKRSNSEARSKALYSPQLLLKSPKSPILPHKLLRKGSVISPQTRYIRSHAASPLCIPLTEGIPETTLSVLYNARCKDLQIPVLSGQYIRFRQNCAQYMKNRSCLLYTSPSPRDS